MREKILKLLPLIGLDVERAVEQLIGTTVEQFTRNLFNDEVRGSEPALRAVSIVRDAFLRHAATLKERLIALYSEALTEEAEVDALIAFYESPAGRKIVKVGATAAAQLQTIGTTWQQEVFGSIDEELAAVLGPITTADNGEARPTA